MFRGSGYFSEALYFAPFKLEIGAIEKMEVINFFNSFFSHARPHVGTNVVKGYLKLVLNI